VTAYRNVERITVEFRDRENVPAAIIIDGSLPDSDLVADVSVDEDGLTAAIEITGKVPNGTGYGFKSLEGWELIWRRRGEDGRSVKNKAELGPVGKGVLLAVLLAFLSPVVWVVWDATIRWVQR
jgi:hypothetical protein